MNNTNTGGPAFPLKEPMSNDFQGMTLRDYFAAKAMQGLLAGMPGLAVSVAAGNAYAMADAMLKAREQ